MATSNRKKSSPSAAFQNKKEDVQVQSEEELFSPEICPINDPWKEKKLIELNISDYMWYLWVEMPEEREGTFSVEALGDRIRKVYRLCFESEKKGNMKVINDFARFHPHLALNSPWLAFLVEKHPTFVGPGDNSARTRLLEAIGRGFHRAAYSKLRTNRRIRSVKLRPGRASVEIFKGELRTFYKSVDWVHADKEEVVSEKVKELVKRYPCLEKSRKELREHLLSKSVSKAAQLIVNKISRVRVHDLKSKAKWQF